MMKLVCDLISALVVGSIWLSIAVAFIIGAFNAIDERLAKSRPPRAAKEGHTIFRVQFFVEVPEGTSNEEVQKTRSMKPMEGQMDFFEITG